MSCAPAPCPPSAPSPSSQPSLTVPAGYVCGAGTTYYNSPQTYVDSCPGGSPTAPISVTVQAYTFSSSVSQNDADNQAMASATSQAQALRVLTPCQAAPAPGGNFLVTEGGDFIMTESGDFLTT